MSNLYIWHARAYIVRICILMVAFGISLNSNAQCFTPCGGTYTAPPTYSITGSTNWSGVQYNMLNDLTISGSLTISSSSCLNFSSSTTPYEIHLTGTGSLTIIGGSTIFASNLMWKGIRADAGTSVTITSSTIANAQIGVYAVNVTNEAVLTITGSMFCNNETGIKIGALTPSTFLSTSISDNEFTAPSLISPHTGEPGDYGIYVDEVNSSTLTYGVVLGDGSAYSGSSTFNYFHDLNIGIRCFKSEVLVQDNKFEDILGFSGTPLGGDSPFANTAIVSTWPGGSGIGTIKVGSAVASPGTYQNLIDNCANGIVAKDYVQAIIYSNDIESNFTAGSYSMVNGVLVKNRNNVVDISGNLIMNFTNNGIDVEDQLQGSLTISDNFILGTGGFSNTLSPTAIKCMESSYTGSQSDFITGNNIQYVRTGISCENISRLDVNTNIVDFVRPNGNAYGLQFINCPNVFITANQVTATCTNVSGCDLHAWPLYIDDCDGFDADQNQLNDGGASMRITNDCSESNITCNEMNNAETFGVLLISLMTDAIGDPYIESTSGDAADNSWFPSTGPTASWANRIRTQAGTNVGGVQWRYRNTSNEFNMPGATLDPGGGTVMLNAILDNDGNACENPYSMRTDGDEYLLDRMDHKYSHWISTYMEGEPDYSAYNYAHMRRFWNYIAENELQAYLVDDYASLFAEIDASNIPTFKSVRDAIAHGDLEMASELNNGIEPVNDVEYYWQLTNSIYLSNLDEDGNFVLNAGIEPELRSIAELPATEYSKGVFQAWAMLDTIIVKDVDVEEKSAAPKYEGSTWIYPNPAVDAVTVINNNHPNEDFKFYIFDALGKKVKEVEKPQSGQFIDISELPAGFYTVVFKNEFTYLYNGKLLIVK